MFILHNIDGSGMTYNLEVFNKKNVSILKHGKLVVVY